jgi:hypothetical protein
MSDPKDKERKVDLGSGTWFRAISNDRYIYKNYESVKGMGKATTH